jgi:hypothetical protein
MHSGNREKIMEVSNRRKFFRTPTRLPLKWPPLSDEENASMEKGEASGILEKEDLPNPIDEILEGIPPGSA